MFAIHRVPLLRAASLLGASVFVGSTIAAVPISFEIDPNRSTVRIESRESSLPFEVSIANLAGSVRAGGDQAMPRSLELVFDLSSLDNGDPQLNEMLRGRHKPRDRGRYGVTLATDVHPAGRSAFTADTTLTLRDLSCKAPLSFDWRVANENGQSIGFLHGTSRINARDFDLQFDDSWDRVLTVTYDLRLNPVNGKTLPVTRWRPDTGLVADELPQPRCAASAPSAGAFSPEAVRARQRARIT